jgi:GT2 family glycosyltransferase
MNGVPAPPFDPFADVLALDVLRRELAERLGCQPPGVPHLWVASLLSLGHGLADLGRLVRAEAPPLPDAGRPLLCWHASGRLPGEALLLLARHFRSAWVIGPVGEMPELQEGGLRLFVLPPSAGAAALAGAVAHADAWLGESKAGYLAARALGKPAIHLHELAPRGTLLAGAETALVTHLYGPPPAEDPLARQRLESALDLLAGRLARGEAGGENQLLGLVMESAAQADLLRQEVARLEAELAALRLTEARGRATFRHRVTERLFSLARKLPGLVPVLRGFAQAAQALLAAARHLRNVASSGHWQALLGTGLPWARLGGRISRPAGEAAAWLEEARPSPRALACLRRRRWGDEAPQFLTVVHGGDSSCRAETLASLKAQAYPHWTTEGDCSHVMWIPAGSRVEPQALARLAGALADPRVGLAYADEALCPPLSSEPIRIEARPAFSYDRLLCEDYLGGLIALPSGILRRIPRRRPSLDELLAAVERATLVAHVPEVLLRSRLAVGGRGASDEGDAWAVRAHLARRGIAAQVRLQDGCRTLQLPLAEETRVAIIIPTRDRVDLLRKCLESLQATLPDGLADVYVIDHESREPRTHAYLAEQRMAQVLRHSGPFNFSAINNAAIARASRRRPYSHFLLLNNDTQALFPGWLEHMAGLACRPEVGVVGAVLAYPGGAVQHAGVVVGQHFGADNRGMGEPLFEGGRRRWLAVTDQAAVTAACMLVRADTWEALGGFDEGFAVGFGDVDFCLRARQSGWKTLLDGQSLLIHHESQTRGKGQSDPHPLDTLRFRQRWAEVIQAWDDWSSPLMSRHHPGALGPAGKPAPPRIVPVVLAGRARLPALRVA